MDAREVLGILDLTLLDHDASESELEIFCNNANKHKPYSVCVFSKHVEFVRKRLDDGTVSYTHLTLPTKRIV